MIHNLSEIGQFKGERALQYIFDKAFEDVLENIKDERTFYSDKRKIKIEIVYTPQTDERVLVDETYSVKVELAPLIGGHDVINATHAGQVVLDPHGYNPGQIDFRDFEDA